MKIKNEITEGRWVKLFIAFNIQHFKCNSLSPGCIALAEEIIKSNQTELAAVINYQDEFGTEYKILKSEIDNFILTYNQN
jgi:hypothetical protein